MVLVIDFGSIVSGILWVAGIGLGLWIAILFIYYVLCPIGHAFEGVIEAIPSPSWLGWCKLILVMVGLGVLGIVFQSNWFIAIATALLVAGLIYVILRK